MRVWVDEDVCTGCGLCVDKCPGIFELDDGVAYAVVSLVPEGEEERVEVAIDECPVDAIGLED